MPEMTVPIGDPHASNGALDSLRTPRGVFLIRLMIGGLFLTTAALKVFTPAESAALAITYNVSPLLTAAVVQAELVLAILLLFGCWTKRVLVASAVLFAIFGIFSAYRGWAGYESCGCFGSLKVNPWITATLDGIMLLLAVWAARKLNSPRQETKPVRFYLAGGAYALAGLLAAVVMIGTAPLSLTDGSFSDAGGLVILEPNSWMGQPFPLGSQLTPEIAFDKGHWTLLLYHHDCPHCQVAVPRYEQLAREDNERRVVLIETPPYGSEEPSEGAAIRVRLSDAREWFVQTPVEIQISDGVVVRASLDLPAITNTPSLLSQRISSSDLPSSLFAK